MSNNNRKRRRWAIAAVSCLILLGLILAATPWVVSAMLPAGIVYAPNQERSIDPSEDQRFVPAGTRHLRIAVGPPRASLSCLIVDPRASPKGTVFLLHGIRDRKESLLGTARRLASKGLRAVVVDHRGHGRSSGRYLTYGVVEGRDMKQVVDALAERRLLVSPLMAVDFSYGGSVAIQLAAREPRIKRVVSISTFSSLSEVVPNYIETFLPGLHHLVSRERIEAGLAEAGQVAGFDPQAADTAQAAARAKARILIMHGAADRKIFPAHARRLQAAVGTRGRLVIVPKEGHDSMMADKTGEVRRATDAWLQTAITPD